jgi:LmbE family N-acetylglucosaminyl deacetylase
MVSTNPLFVSSFYFKITLLFQKQYIMIINLYNSLKINNKSYFVMRENKMQGYRFLLTTLSLLFFVTSHGQVAPKKPTSSDIYEAIQKLNVLGSVLYVAAHPDDENTRMISYFANARHIDITYLSLTRGDGGQNLIGSELREMLGALRTQELLMARYTDGGKQLFSRANDFGFSKSPAETMRIWGKQEVLSDVVWAIRKLQPDILINRFSTDTSYDTHGHHTSSAIMGVEAFEVSNDPSVFSEQMKYGVKPWQPRRIFQNISWWWFQDQAKFDEYVKKEQTVTIDAGVYLPTRGKSNDEIAAESRSMHKCQAMGMLSSRGSSLEYLQYLKGSKSDVKATKDPFEGINTSWSRLEGGEPIGKALAEIQAKFRLDDPSASLSDLVKVRGMIQKLPESVWKTRKLKDIEEVIKWSAGLYLEATSDGYSYVGAASGEMTIEAINRSNAKVKLDKVSMITSKNCSTCPFPALIDTVFQSDLTNNKRVQYKKKVKIPDNISLTTPYWLTEKAPIGLYTVKDQILRGLPETPRDLKAVFDITIEGQAFRFEADIVHRYANPAKGEIYRPLEITPPVFVNIAEKVYVFGDNDPKDVRFVVKSGSENVTGYLKPEVPKGWRIEPNALDFNLKFKNEETVLSFKLFPPDGESEAIVKAQAYVMPKMAVSDNTDPIAVLTKSVKLIEYDHIPTQTVLMPAESKIVKLDVKKRGTQIGYFMGAGDDVPACLEQIDYNVTQLTDSHFQNAEGLNKFDAIVLGIRAYNTKEKLKFYNTKLLDYVKNGGTVLVQYNTNGRDLVLPNFGPYPFKVGRNRTTEEDAEMRMLKPNHAVLNIPNKITSKDFDGWVQERGLYFLSEWDAQYEAILSCNDLNEKKEDGALLVAKYGKGYYIYTGLSFFREMPMGVPGAYRLFANLLSIGKQLP